MSALRCSSVRALSLFGDAAAGAPGTVDYAALIFVIKGVWYAMTTVYRWTGREAKLLRTALRLSIRDFAARLGVGARTVNKWEARQTGITPLPYMQQVLDTALERASDEVKARFTEGVALTQRDELVVAERKRRGSDGPDEPAEDAGDDPVLAAPWDQRGSVEASVALSSGGSLVEPQCFSLLAGVGLTAPAHQWLIRDPEPLCPGCPAVGYQWRWSIRCQP
jgi:transcriptional regulator with XRE-family HTH domain